MKKLIIKTKQADFKQGKFIDNEIVEVVASTKSENNLLDEMKKQGTIIAEVIEKDLFLNKNGLLEIVRAYVDSEIKEEDLAIKVYEHIAKVLDGGCIFYKPFVRNQK